MNSQIPDDLTPRLQAREHEAFNELVRLCHGSVYRLAHRLLRNVDDAQEVAQESFLAAYEGITGFQGRSSVKTWLMSITYRKAIDRLKKRSEEAAMISAGLEETDLWKVVRSVENFTDWGANPEQNLSHSQLADFLRSVLEKIPAESKAVFELRDIQGMSSKEASAILGMNEGAVRVRLHRVRQLLMAELNLFFGEASRKS